ncbi:hypothetical protein [uncultured Erythrobacter sp.]|uniref:hypothetical protein n=1 Tax=uncultured Erythrobacter sp. TaxID=263913 RepID=UPI00261FE920|nr:hypothetical protein [uncultured Erythrobacter sp.]
MTDDDSRYMSDEQIRAREEANKPWYKRARDGCLSGCSIDLFAIILLIGVPTWWLL